MENNFNLIERFFSGVMNQAEITEFETRRLTDEAFANEVALYQKANELIKAGARQRLKRQLLDMGRNDMTVTMIEPFIRYRMIRKYMAIAASVIVLFGLSYFAFYTIRSQKPVPTLAVIYSRYYVTPEVDQAISRGTEEKGLIELNWSAALQKYSNRQYPDALTDLKRLLTDTAFTYTSAAHFFAGICYMNISMPDSATIQFGKVSKSSSFIQDATWYRGMSYLKAGDIKGAASVFNEISESDRHYKKKEAREILKSLRRAKRTREK